MTQFSYPPFGTGNLANPTASVGLTAINGSATTAMRSDAAPPLDQTAAYAFSGLGNTTLASGKVLKLDAGTVSAPAVTLAGDTTSGWYSPGAGNWNYSAGGSRMFGLTGSNNTMFAVNTSNQVVNYWNLNGTTNSVQLNGSARFGFTPTTDGTAALDVILSRGGAAATLQLGAANAASPVAQTLQAQGSRAGTDANTVGGALSISAGIGTGNVGTSTLTLNGIIGNATTTTTAQTKAAGISVPGVASGQLPGAVIGSAAIATNATDGFLYIASGAGPPTGTPTAFTGRVPLYYDSTNDQLYIYQTTWKQPKTPAGAAIVNWQ